jgi:hypothetical protein
MDDGIVVGIMALVVVALVAIVALFAKEIIRDKREGSQRE